MRIVSYGRVAEPSHSRWHGAGRTFTFVYSVKRIEKLRYNSAHSQPQTQAQLLAQAALSSGNEPVVPTGWRTGWVRVSDRIFLEKSLLTRLRIKPWLLGFAASNTATILTTLLGLPTPCSLTRLGWSLLPLSSGQRKSEIGGLTLFQNLYTQLPVWKMS